MYFEILRFWLVRNKFRLISDNTWKYFQQLLVNCYGYTCIVFCMDKLYVRVVLSIWINLNYGFFKIIKVLTFVIYEIYVTSYIIINKLYYYNKPFDNRVYLMMTA